MKTRTVSLLLCALIISSSTTAQAASPVKTKSAPKQSATPKKVFYKAPKSAPLSTIYDTEGCAVGFDSSGKQVTTPILQALVNNVWLDVKTIEIGWKKTCNDSRLPNNKYFAFARAALGNNLKIRWKFIGPVNIFGRDESGNGISRPVTFYQRKKVVFYDPPPMAGANPITFANITSRIDEIAPIVWQNSQDVIAQNANLPGAKTPFVIYRSPHLGDGFYKDASLWMKRVNSLYANFAHPIKTYLYFTTGQDLESTYKEVSKSINDSYARDIKELYGSSIFGRSIDCKGSSPGRAHTQFPELIGMVFAGSCIDGEFNNEDMVTHEYTHQIQEAQLWNGQRSGRDIVEPCWMVEGQATLTAGVELDTLQRYLDTKFGMSHPYLLGPGGTDYVDNPKITWTKEYVLNYYKDANIPSECKKTNKFALSYSVGFLTVEALSAIRGIESHMSFEQKLGAGVPYDKAFLDTFGITWDEAAPILATVVATQMAKVNN